ncbi:major capsid protein [uncultured Duncaniella sp.]|uniref:major capsid protein n=1 Tax=uncultured Duncaniella sp. TaxID=2768039 RepID=UPI002631FE1C|nr:major capsid protein [uncultured Duncaniella sp.]
MSNPLFSSIRLRKPKKNRFNLSHNVKLTGKFGKLIPILCTPTLPGDTFKCNTELLVRFAPMMAPIMHKVDVYTHFFFVPNRLVWSHWKDFITGGESGTEAPVYPRMRIDDKTSVSQLRQIFYNGSLADYLGFPVLNKEELVMADNFIELDALPFRAYNLIWNEYYRDQNVMHEVDIHKDDDGITAANVTLMCLKSRSWKKDYFTSALPFPQRGDDVELPLQGTAEMIYDAAADAFSIGQGLTVTRKTNGDAPSPGAISSNGDYLKGVDGSFIYLGNDIGDPQSDKAVITSFKSDQLSKLIKGVDLSKVSSATINELRRAIKAQEFLETAARGGSRYIEQIYSYFGVRSSDARLQRPEFLGGGKSPVVISDVLQTSQTTTGENGSPQASPAGHAVSVQRSHSFKYFCEEHGFIIGIMSIMPKPAYQQGLPRLFQKFDRLDYYWPQFAHLGEQEIKGSEIYYNLNTPHGDMHTDWTFGYTPRYAEYKFMNDSVHGDFRDSLKFWHMGRIFANAPALNEAFLTNVEDAANRVFAVEDEEFDKIWINCQHNLVALRPMPKYGTPLF